VGTVSPGASPGGCWSTRSTSDSGDGRFGKRRVVIYGLSGAPARLCVCASSCTKEVVHPNVMRLGVRESTRGSAPARKRASNRRLSGRRRVAASAADYSLRPRPEQRLRQLHLVLIIDVCAPTGRQR